jgi:hypothetical protein
MALTAFRFQQFDHSVESPKPPLDVIDYFAGLYPKNLTVVLNSKILPNRPASQ